MRRGGYLACQRALPRVTVSHPPCAFHQRHGDGEGEGAQDEHDDRVALENFEESARLSGPVHKRRLVEERHPDEVHYGH